MGDILQIQSEKEYHAFVEAITKYNLQKQAQKETLIGTYWRVDVDQDSSFPGQYYYFVNKESSKSYSAFCIKDTIKGVEIDSSTFLVNPHTKNSKNKVTILSQKQFVTDTTPLLVKYGLKWI